ncbi:MAG: hypothetical protein ACM3VX_06105 [Bacteroidota bacterium]
MAIGARAWGAYYTCRHVADYLARWAIRAAGDRVLEPSFGNGVFLEVAHDRLVALGGSCDSLFGVELRKEAFARVWEDGALGEKNGLLGDFLALEPFPVQAVIGNPPYVRLRNLDPDSRARAIGACERLGVPMAPSGSVWMPFVVHASSFLTFEGRLAFVLPHEMTYVRYAAPLWSYLASKFGQLKVIRTQEDLFPENDEEAILLLAEGYGHSTSAVKYEVYETSKALLQQQPMVTASIPIESVVSGQRPFVSALLNGEQLALLSSLAATGRVRSISRECKFRIGYVAGDKRFFHPDATTQARYGLPAANLRKAVINSRQLRGVGVQLQEEAVGSSLYYPAKLTAADLAYIEQGEKAGVSGRYKCRVREPWYLTPGVETPDLLLSVFAERPLLILNKAKATASNSLLCGFLRGDTVPEELVCRWYNNLTLLSVELQVHSLGGGVLVLIPGEADTIRIPSVVNRELQPRLLAELDALLKRENVDAAYALGDELILRRSLGLSEHQVQLIRDAGRVLRQWRNARKRKASGGLFSPASVF